ncbi:NYN domain-containing protein [Blastopirellula sp. JC732]|uniref:NYN domain-containing protein n=1 Tax=Blastopirellula sediminis TaxID=2894196 RepID=A0A9X1MR05_9BACT|nr:NYN domain-containing protein [Blastopirellula sediminis]MCC9605611.1 NYN domain-containing protein [Blastopirellula sediminis]MCC9631089.1 NYN domain-containing protein [Blastopirellula sediminis]
MPLIIDGYNLLYAAGVVSSLDGSGTFEQDRLALLELIRSVVDDEEIRQTVVVFDSAKAPPGLPRTVRYHDIVVHFASEYADADEMIEMLIERHATPRRLTVVSSDHRVQRAARRRKATAIDSGHWIDLMRRKRRAQNKAAQIPTKPIAPPSESEVSRWMREFSEIDIDQISRELKPLKRPTPPPTPPKPVDPEQAKSAGEEESEKPDVINPFPDEFEDDIRQLGSQLGGSIFPADYLDQIAREFWDDDDKPSR